jgi:hypothetical protein
MKAFLARTMRSNGTFSVAQRSATQYHVNVHSAAIDEIVSVRRNRFEERRGVRFHVPVHEYPAGGVGDADVHRFHVEISIVTMLPVVESDSALLLRDYAQVPALSLPSW